MRFDISQQFNWLLSRCTPVPYAMPPENPNPAIAKLLAFPTQAPLSHLEIAHGKTTTALNRPIYPLESGSPVVPSDMLIEVKIDEGGLKASGFLAGVSSEHQSAVQATIRENPETGPRMGKVLRQVAWGAARTKRRYLRIKCHRLAACRGKEASPCGGGPQYSGDRLGWHRLTMRQLRAEDWLAQSLVCLLRAAPTPARRWQRSGAHNSFGSKTPDRHGL